MRSVILVTRVGHMRRLISSTMGTKIRPVYGLAKKSQDRGNNRYCHGCGYRVVMVRLVER